MGKIQQLSPHLANLIAAGEVVERPASVVKELLENAVDAGAHQVVVELREGGMVFLRVTDDGCGMAPQDAQTAFLRHATSKLRSERDLAAIGTLGFRGEALAAISAGAVFMGANSYIGNAPNFMVRSIAEEQGVAMPSFFGYMAWSVGILIPLFLILTWLFFI